MSDTASFTDPVFLARFGLARVNVLDYFLHPLNPFRTKANTSNEVLSMQGIGIGMLIAHGINGEGPMSPVAAEEEYNKALSRLTGEQYELLPPTPPPVDPAASSSTPGGTTTAAAPPPHPVLTLPQLYALPSPLYTLRHVLRTSATVVKVLGIYYVVEGVVYKSPTVRSAQKTVVARTAAIGLSAPAEALAACARYLPATGYTWVFEASVEDPVSLTRLAKRKTTVVADHRRPGERTAAEEEGIRAAEAIDSILVRLSKSLNHRRKKRSKVAAVGNGSSGGEVIKAVVAVAEGTESVD